MHISNIHHIRASFSDFLNIYFHLLYRFCFSSPFDKLFQSTTPTLRLHYRTKWWHNSATSHHQQILTQANNTPTDRPSHRPTTRFSTTILMVNSSFVKSQWIFYSAFFFHLSGMGMGVAWWKPADGWRIFTLVFYSSARKLRKHLQTPSLNLFYSHRV